MPSAASSLARRHPPAPRGCLRPFARRNARERRLGQRLAMGLTPAQAAHAEGVAPAEVEVLLAEPGFRELVAGFEELAAKPEAELRQILTRLARFLLLEAAAFGDVRVAFFVLHQERQGRDPARTLADGVIAARRRTPRSAAPARPAPPAPAEPAARPPIDPTDRLLQRTGASLRAALEQEHAVHHDATAPEPPAEPEPAPPGPAADPDSEPLVPARHRSRQAVPLTCRPEASVAQSLYLAELVRRQTANPPPARGDPNTR